MIQHVFPSKGICSRTSGLLKKRVFRKGLHQFFQKKEKEKKRKKRKEKRKYKRRRKSIRHTHWALV